MNISYSCLYWITSSSIVITMLYSILIFTPSKRRIKTSRSTFWDVILKILSSNFLNMFTVFEINWILKVLCSKSLIHKPEMAATDFTCHSSELFFAKLSLIQQSMAALYLKFQNFCKINLLWQLFILNL